VQKDDNFPYCSTFCVSIKRQIHCVPWHGIYLNIQSSLTRDSLLTSHTLIQELIHRFQDPAALACPNSTNRVWNRGLGQIGDLLRYFLFLLFFHDGDCNEFLNDVLSLLRCTIVCSSTKYFVVGRKWNRCHRPLKTVCFCAP